MLNKSSSNGITLIALIITVIILLILISVSTYTGLESYGRAERTEFVSRMQLIQAKIDDLVRKKDFDFNKYGEAISDTKQSSIITKARENKEILEAAETDKFRYFSKENLKDQLDIDIEDEIIVNFSTREVISLTGVRYKGKIYYTQYKLPKGQQLVQYTEQENELDFEYSKKNEGLNVIIKITPTRNGKKIENGIIKYKLSDEQEEQYRQVNKDTIKISKSGIYTIQLSDIYGTKPVEKNINIQLINSPMLIKDWTKITVNANTTGTFEEYKESEITTWYDYAEDIKQYAYAKDTDNNYYIWIPRYAKNNETEEIKLIKGNSNTFTDETAYNNDEWTIPEEFSPNNIKLTGFWLKVQEPNSQNIDEYIKNINKDNIVYVYE